MTDHQTSPQEVQRIPIAAAVRTDDGLVHSMPPPHRHHHIVHAMALDDVPIIQARGEQGFLMSDGQFADRETAGACAIRWGRIEKLQHPPKLYSEDLW